MRRLILTLVLILAAFLLPGGQAPMAANTVTSSSTVIEVSGMDSDWDPDTVYKVIMIMFIPGASNDVMVIKQASATGPTVFYAKSTDGEPRVAYYNGREIRQFLDYGDCTLNAGAKVLVVIDK